MRPLSFAASIALLTSATTAWASVISVPSPNATVELSPRQSSSISALECLLQSTTPVQCCQTVGLLSLLAGILNPILNILGLPIPGLGTLVALNCQDTLLGIGCTDSTLCCATVIPDQGIGLNCQPIDSLL